MTRGELKWNWRIGEFGEKEVSFSSSLIALERAAENFGRVCRSILYSNSFDAFRGRNVIIIHAKSVSVTASERGNERGNAKVAKTHQRRVRRVKKSTTNRRKRA